MRWVPDAKEIDIKNMKILMYMPNAKILRWGPNATYIPLEMGFALGSQRNLHKKNEMYMANSRNSRHLTQEIPTCWYFLR